MSLIGSLEDLGLGDILQIISLSQKSGVLSIRGEQGEGSIILRDGLVRGAHVKGGPVDLRGVLVGGGFLENDEYDVAGEQARRAGTTLEEALAAHTALTAERIDSLRRESVEAAVVSMFAWRTGEFSFEVRADLEEGDPVLFLPTGINAQYLAMEGSRLEDESSRPEWPEEGPGADGPMPEMSAAEMFGATDSEPVEVAETGAAAEPVPEAPMEPVIPIPAAADALALAVAERVGEGEDEGEMLAEALVEEEPAAADAVPPEAPATPPQKSAVAEAAPVPSADGSASGDVRPNAPLVIIDSDLVALEWMKRTLVDVFPRIHIFQRWDLGLSPIRQYLARANRPVVMLQPNAEGDPLSGIRDSRDFVARLKTQQPRLPVLWLTEHGGPGVDDAGRADGVLTRPNSQQLRSPRAASELEPMGDALRQELAGILSRDLAASESRPPAGARGAERSAAELRRLKQVTEALADASTRGEVLPVSIQFAAEVFERVAIFMVRGDAVVGMAQHGLPKAGGPDDEGLRGIQVDRHGCAWFRQVTEGRRSVRSGPTDGGDYTLAALLGNAAAREAYVAPVESDGEVVAILYADNLPHHRPLGDTEAVDVVLQHVGLALERAMLERALAEVQDQR